jgi:hypothetical protein
MIDRFESEVRHCIKLGIENKVKLENYLEQVVTRRGKPEADRLRDTSRAQYRLGNLGAWGEWK